MATLSTGLHIIRKRVKSGDRFYVYAYRGGPCIHVQDGARPSVTPHLLDLAYAERRHKGKSNTLNQVIDLYRASIAFTEKAVTTQADYRSWLDRISYRFGALPVRMLANADMRGELIAWRDELSKTPRAADRAIGMMSTLLAWGEDRNLVPANPAKGIKTLHKANRADMIWELPHWFAVAPLPAHITRAIGLAGMTGLALTDFVSLQWDQVRADSIEGARRKTGGIYTVPLYPALRAFMGARTKGHVLLNSHGKPWTVSGFKSSWQKNKPDGFDRTLHDLRGTFATRLMMQGFSDQQLAMILGWAPDRIAAIRARYVDRARVVREMARALSA